jgi:inosine-uridine nucleoside N-ribohydrolase
MAQEKTKIILDADTGNEVDDFYALARILMEPSIEILALNAAHWQTSHWAEPQSMENSHRLNQQLLGEMGLELKTNRGAIARMYDWGDMAQHSAAAYEIIQQVQKLQKEEQLTIIALGALTNVASAIFIEPKIAKRIKLYWLGTSYDFEKNILYRNDFNCAMDQYALTHLLFSEAEMHIVPVNIAAKMEFDFSETKEKFKDNELGVFLVNRWYNHIDGARAKRIIWDLSIVDLFLNPKWGEEVQVTTSKDNGNKKVYFYKDLAVDKMKADFYKHILEYKK